MPTLIASDLNSGGTIAAYAPASLAASNCLLSTRDEGTKRQPGLTLLTSQANDVIVTPDAKEGITSKPYCSAAKPSVTLVLENSSTAFILALALICCISPFYSNRVATRSRNWNIILLHQEFSNCFQKRCCCNNAESSLRIT